MSDYHETEKGRPRDGKEITPEEWRDKQEKRIVPVPIADDREATEEIPITPKDLERILQEEKERERRANRDVGNN